MSLIKRQTTICSRFVHFKHCRAANRQLQICGNFCLREKLRINSVRVNYEYDSSFLKLLSTQGICHQRLNVKPNPRGLTCLQFTSFFVLVAMHCNNINPHRLFAHDDRPPTPSWFILVGMFGI